MLIINFIPSGNIVIKVYHCSKTLIGGDTFWGHNKVMTLALVKVMSHHT